MLATTNSACLHGVTAHLVHVEANSGETGDPRVVLVGLPDAAVKEAIDRVRSSLVNSGYSLPRTRVTINLAPSDLRKEGASYDLPIAISLLGAIKKDMHNSMSQYLIAGELSLSGEVRPIKGAIAMALLAKKLRLKGIILPLESAQTASVVEGVSVIGVQSLSEAYDFITGIKSIEPIQGRDGIFDLHPHAQNLPNFTDIKGQGNVRRAVEIAVAGGHNFLMIGPPGSGKSMVAKRVPSILPPPSHAELLEILNISSAVNETEEKKSYLYRRPFRAPHHTTSDVGLIGGGTIPGPGEISLAHQGVLFLDELPEFRRSALEVLRQPLEDGEVTISRSAGKITLPAQFILVAAMNPCPCGYLGSREHNCRCSIPQVHKYRNRISGPLLDRIDIHVEASPVKIDELQNSVKGESSEEISDRILACREIQAKRYKNLTIKTNARIPDSHLEDFCHVNDSDALLLKQAMKDLSLSARAYNRILKVARTIADLAKSKNLEKIHILEAIQYRSLDRKFF